MSNTLNKRGFRAFFGAQDMTVGSPMRSMLLFSIPLLIGNIGQLLYNTVDSIVVGQYAGPNALAATGVSQPIMMVLSIFFMTVATGISVMVSQYFGAKDRENLEKTVGNAIVLVFIAGALTTVLGLILSPWILNITNCPEVIKGEARAYQDIIFAGFIGMAFYNIISGILRGLGDSMFPLFVLLGTTLLNVVLDIWMVAPASKLWGIGLGWGISGAAWATIISQALSALVVIWRLLHMKQVLTVKGKNLLLDKYICRQVARLGLPSGIQQMIMSMSFVFIQSIMNSILIPFGHTASGVQLFDGAMYVAVNTAVMKIDGFAIMPSQTFNQAASTYTGQNIGAGKIDRIAKGMKVCLLLAFSVTIIVFATVFFGGRSLMGLFINDTRESVVSMAVSEESVRESIIEVYGTYDDTSVALFLDGSGYATIEAYAASTDHNTELLSEYAAKHGLASGSALFDTPEAEAITLIYVQERGFESIEDYNKQRSNKIVEVGFEMQRIIVWCYFLMAVANTVGGVMRGAGDTLAQLIIMICTNIAIRLPITKIMVNLSKNEMYPNGQPSMLFWSMVIAFGLNVIVTCIYFSTGKWKTKGVVKPIPILSGGISNEE